MTKRVLLVGLLPDLVDGFREQLDGADVEILGGTGVQDIGAAFAEADVDHVFLGGGLDIGVRLAAVRAVFESSDIATVHLKDHVSGPEGFLPFVQSVLRGLDGYEPRPSDRAILRAQRPDT